MAPELALAIERQPGLGFVELNAENHDPCVPLAAPLRSSRIRVKVVVSKHLEAVRGQQIDGMVTLTEGSRTTKTVTFRKGQVTLTAGPLVALGDRVGHQIVARYSGNLYYAASKAILIQYVQS